MLFPYGFYTGLLRLSQSVGGFGVLCCGFGGFGVEGLWWVLASIPPSSLYFRKKT